MCTRTIVPYVRPAGNVRPRRRGPLCAVYGVYAHGPRLYDEPVARELRAGDITESGGRFVRLIPNHNGQRLQSVDVHDEVCAVAREVSNGHRS